MQMVAIGHGSESYVNITYSLHNVKNLTIPAIPGAVPLRNIPSHAAVADFGVFFADLGDLVMDFETLLGLFFGDFAGVFFGLFFAAYRKKHIHNAANHFDSVS